MKDKALLIILIIALLFLITNLEGLPFFILYGGVEIEGEITNQTAQCWTLATDRCVKQKVFLINFTKQNLLVCPELHHSTELECQKAFKLIEEPKPTVTCYYIEKECKVEVIVGLEKCPSKYYSTMDECKEALETPLYHIKTLFKNKATIFTLIAGIIIVVILILSRRK